MRAGVPRSRGAPVFAVATPMFPWVTMEPLGLPVHLWIYLAGFALLCFGTSITLTRRGDFGVGDSVALCLCLLAGVMVGGKIFHVVDHLELYVADPGRIWAFAGHGINGGIVAGLAVGALYLRARRRPVLAGLDVILLFMPLAIAVGRVACLLTADGDYGVPTDLPWGMTFAYGYYPTRVPVHPAPLYEILALLALFVGLKLAVVGRRPAGWTSAIAMAGYATQRFLIEIIRLNKRHLLGMTLSQWTCLALLLVSLALLAWLWSQERRQAMTPAVTS